MLEIKFRAWDKYNKRYNGRFCIGDDGSFIDMTSGDPNDWKLVKNMTVHRYTGLKDSKGTEIYEGDILTELGHVKKVEWSEEGAGWVFVVLHNTIHNYSASIVVIGNIYENPELLK